MDTMIYSHLKDLQTKIKFVQMRRLLRLRDTSSQLTEHLRTTWIRCDIVRICIDPR